MAFYKKITITFCILLCLCRPFSAQAQIISLYRLNQIETALERGECEKAQMIYQKYLQREKSYLNKRATNLKSAIDDCLREQRKENLQKPEKEEVNIPSRQQEKVSTQVQAPSTKVQPAPIAQEPKVQKPQKQETKQIPHIPSPSPEELRIASYNILLSKGDSLFIIKDYVQAKKIFEQALYYAGESTEEAQARITVCEKKLSYINDINSGDNAFAQKQFSLARQHYHQALQCVGYIDQFQEHQNLDIDAVELKKMHLVRSRIGIIDGDCETAKLKYDEYLRLGGIKDTTLEYDIQYCFDDKKNLYFKLENNCTFKMIYVQGGVFTMGWTDKQLSYFHQHYPKDESMLKRYSIQHDVFLDDYYIAETEVTQELWNAVMGENSVEWSAYESGNDYPAVNISWYKAQEFIKKLNKLTNEKFSLPSEAEWEYAARGGGKSKNFVFSGADNYERIGNASKQLKAVKKFSPNELGIYDMSGNVWEYCLDEFVINYSLYKHGGEYFIDTRTLEVVESPIVNPLFGSEKPFEVVVRGGSYNNTWDNTMAWVPTVRIAQEAVSKHKTLGFRIALHKQTHSENEDPEFFLQCAKSQLDSGECVKAEINYKWYRDLSHKKDPYIEQRIEVCKNGQTPQRRNFFNLPPCPSIKKPVQDYDGNTYNTILIGNHCWLKENMRTLHFSDGTDVFLSDPNKASSKEPLCYVPNNDTSLVLQYGYLYNWSAATRSPKGTSLKKVQGVCPDGWRLPTKLDWKSINNFLERHQEYCYAGISKYTAKAIASETGWEDVSSEKEGKKGPLVGYNPFLNNLTGFSAYPAGEYSQQRARVDYYSNDICYFQDAGSKAIFWSLDSINSMTQIAWCAILSNNSTIMTMKEYDNKYTPYYKDAHSIRCVRYPVLQTASEHTNPSPCPESPTVTDIDGNVYNTVLIGNQCWMKENLRTTHFPTGKTIDLRKKESTSSTHPYRCYPGGKSKNARTHGYLYNWAAIKATSNDLNENEIVQGICPNGWHIPSKKEWSLLLNFVRSKPEWSCDVDTNKIGKALASETGWMKPTRSSSPCSIGNNPSTNNATGFSAIPAGCSKMGFGYEAYFWGCPGNYSLSLDGYKSKAYLGEKTKSQECSVRCIRD